MHYPKRSQNSWTYRIRRKSFGSLLIYLVALFLLISFAFALIYFSFSRWGCKSPCSISFIKCFLYSFTDMYGNCLVLRSTLSRAMWHIVTILHSLIPALYLPFATSILFAKLLYPSDAIIFSNKLIFCKQCRKIKFRLINTNRDIIFEPIVRVQVVEHCSGNTIAKTIAADVAQVAYLGKHDFTFSINDELAEGFSVSKNYNDALTHDQLKPVSRSRFRVIIAVAGICGMQPVTAFKKYYASDIVEGKRFAPIEYNNADQKSVFKYRKIPNMWEQFNKVEM